MVSKSGYEVGDKLKFLNVTKKKMESHPIKGFFTRSLAKGVNKKRSKGRVATYAWAKIPGQKRGVRAISNDKVRKTAKKTKKTKRKTKKTKRKH